MSQTHTFERGYQTFPTSAGAQDVEAIYEDNDDHIAIQKWPGLEKNSNLSNISAPPTQNGDHFEIWIDQLKEGENAKNMRWKNALHSLLLNICTKADIGQKDVVKMFFEDVLGWIWAVPDNIFWKNAQNYQISDWQKWLQRNKAVANKETKSKANSVQIPKENVEEQISKSKEVSFVEKYKLKQMTFETFFLYTS